MAKVLSIEIGGSLTKVAEVDYKTKKAKIYNSFVMATPPDMLTPEGEVNANDTFMLSLQKELQDRKIGTKNVVFVVNAQRSVSRTIVIPLIKEAKVHDFVMANASDYFPYSLNGYEVSCDIENELEENGVKKQQVTVNCMPSNIVGSYEKLAESLGFNLVGLDHAGNAIKKMMLAEIPEDLKITFKMEESATIITVVKDNKIQFQRTANYGLDDILDEIKKSDLFGTNLTDLDALSIVERKTLVFKRLSDQTVDDTDADPEVDSVKLKQLRSDITSDLAPLIGNLTKIMDIYIRDKDITLNDIKVYLVGLGSVVSGLGKLISNELGMKVVSPQSFAPQVTGEKVDPSRFAEFFSCCGCAMDPIGIVFEDKWHDKKSGAVLHGKGKGSSKSGSDSLTVPIIFAGVCLILAVALSVFASISYSIAKKQNTELQTQVEKYAYAEELYNQYNAVNADYIWIKGMDSVTYSPNNEMVALIEELEEKMPSDIQVLTLTATKEGVTMNIYVSTKAEVADVISNIRTFTSIQYDGISAINDNCGEGGENLVSFTIDCSYVQQETETESAAAN